MIRVTAISQALDFWMILIKDMRIGYPKMVHSHLICSPEAWNV